MIKFQKLPETEKAPWPAYQIVVVFPDHEEGEVVGLVEQKDRWVAPTARDRWTLRMGDLKSARPHYFETLREVKERIAFVVTDVLRCEMHQRQAPEQHVQSMREALGEAERFVRQLAATQEDKVRARWLSLADHLAKIAG